ncbi:MAG: hypothetical protein BWX66_01517 [Deltaproteobacteria bacterium ADurb.Bin058]|nr:MAG: hypothetical protein BWX66_01517 [Deltaproteobacteria bacterium ADurb.Bin058]
MVVTVTAPVSSALGAVAYTEVADSTTTFGEGMSPKNTESTSAKPYPIMRTIVPPAMAPDSGSTAKICMSGA